MIQDDYPLSRRGLLRALGLSLALAPARSIVALAEGGDPSPLTWGKPPLEKAQTIVIGSDAKSQTEMNLADGTDYVVRFDPARSGAIERRTLRLRGGRNIVLVGGALKRIDDTPASRPDGKRAPFPGELFSIAGHSGTAYVEGLLLDCNNQYGVDGIDVGSPRGGHYILQNIHVKNVFGTVKGSHADGIQIIRPTDELLIDRMTVVSAYTGFQLQPEFPIGLAWLRNCNARYPDPDFRSGWANGYSFWLGARGDSYRNPHRYRLENVYAQERTNFWNAPWEQSSVGPPVREGTGNRLALGRSDRAVFPSMQVEGYVIRGVPPGGDFCPVSRIIDALGVVVYRPATGWQHEFDWRG